MGKGPDMDLSSFQDIMTCILGILILIILLTGIDASQITVLVATPKEDTSSDRRPVFFECRHNTLLAIDFDQLSKECDEVTERLREKTNGVESEFIKEAAQTMVSIPGYTMDYTYSLMGRYVLVPDMEAKGEEVTRGTPDSPSWFDQQLEKVDPEAEFICFFVRPDSYQVFQKARVMAWSKNISVACEVQDEKNPIVLGPGGDRVMQQ